MIRDFNYFWGLALERQRQVREKLRWMNAKQPFESREELHAAYQREMRILEAGAFTTRDELALKQLGISI